MSVSRNLHSALISAATELRKNAQMADINYLHFEIIISGRADGDLNIYMKLANSDYGQHVKGRELDSVIQEWLRRNGWSKENEQLLLPPV